MKYQKGKFMEMQLRLLAAEATRGKVGLEENKVELLKDPEIKSRKQLDGLDARTRGKFRPNFVKRAVEVRGEEVLPLLAEYYSKIGNETITPDILKKEAATPK